MNPIDDDAPVWSAGPDERAGRPLVVLLHGRGGHERDMLRFFGRLAPSQVAVSIRAPIRHGAGWSWLGSIDSDESLAVELDKAGTQLLRWIEGIRGDAPWVGLIGWSQGGAVALQALRIAPHVPAFVVTLGGFSGGSLQADDTGLAHRHPPVFWGRGTDDDVIPPEDIAVMAEFLPSHTALTAVEYANAGHEIAEEEIDDVCTFVDAVTSGLH